MGYEVYDESELEKLTHPLDRDDSARVYTVARALSHLGKERIGDELVPLFDDWIDDPRVSGSNRPPSNNHGLSSTINYGAPTK